MDINNTGIIITGAASGFGRAMAIDLASKGAEIIALDIDKIALKTLKKENSKITLFACDVTDHEKVDQTMIEVFNCCDNINVLINNAGIMKNAPLINLLGRPDRKHPVDLWNKVIAINQTGIFNMTRSFADQMIKKRNKGTIINISSIAAQGNIGQTAYSASKAAVEAMTKVWSKELGRLGIRSVAIAPGFIDTAGTAEAIEEKMLAQWIEKTPLRRTGSINEVIQSIRFVIENDFINGAIININGGLII